MAEQVSNGHDKKPVQSWRKWTPERKAKFQATMRKKRKAKHKDSRRPRAKQDSRVEDAMIYLRQAVRAINRAVAHGQEEDAAHLLTKLALKTLKGEM